MRPNPGETLEEWAKRVDMFERGHALMRIAKGEPMEQVVEDMSRRITQKMLHPILEAIKEPVKVDGDLGRAGYEENYLKKYAPVADHVDGQLFDKP